MNSCSLFQACVLIQLATVYAATSIMDVFSYVSCIVFASWAYSLSVILLVMGFRYIYLVSQYIRAFEIRYISRYEISSVLVWSLVNAVEWLRATQLILLPSLMSFSGCRQITCPDPSWAARIIHWDSTPMSFRRSRFKRKANFLSFKSSGLYQFSSPATACLFSSPKSTTILMRFLEPWICSASNTRPIRMSSFWNSLKEISIWINSEMLNSFLGI